MRLVLLRDLHFTWVFVDAFKSELLTFIFQSENLSSYQTVIFLLPSERLNQLTLTQLVTTVYLSHLSNLPLATAYPPYVSQNV